MQSYGVISTDLPSIFNQELLKGVSLGEKDGTKRRLNHIFKGK